MSRRSTRARVHRGRPAAPAAHPSWGAYYDLDGAGARPRPRPPHRAARAAGRKRRRLVRRPGQPGTRGRMHGRHALGRGVQVRVERYQADDRLRHRGRRPGDAAAGERRATAIASLQKRAPGDGQAARRVADRAGHAERDAVRRDGTRSRHDARRRVDIAGVNVMTMDYGSAPRTATQRCWRPRTNSVTATQHQLGVLYRGRGQPQRSRASGRSIGATPMIGQNDVPDEIFTLADAKASTRGRSRRVLGRIPCGPPTATRPAVPLRRHHVSDACSGVKQGKATFASALSAKFDGRSPGARRADVEPTAPRRPTTRPPRRTRSGRRRPRT